MISMSCERINASGSNDWWSSSAPSFPLRLEEWFAELVKVSPTTAMKHLRNATGYDPDAVRTGADGKEYPAASRRSEEPRVQPSEARNEPAVVEMDLEKDAEESSEQEAHGFVWNQFGV